MNIISMAVQWHFLLVAFNFATGNNLNYWELESYTIQAFNLAFGT